MSDICEVRLNAPMYVNGGIMPEGTIVNLDADIVDETISNIKNSVMAHKEPFEVLSRRTKTAAEYTSKDLENLVVKTQDTDKIKEVEAEAAAKLKEVEAEAAAKLKEVEAKAAAKLKEAEAKLKEAEAKLKEAEAKPAPVDVDAVAETDSKGKSK